MATYQQARANEFTTAAAHVITGVVLDLSEDSPLVAEGSRRPIQMCVCVTDPCDCSGPIIWIKPEDLHGQDSTERSNRDGDPVMELRINPDATVLVESVVRAKATALSIQHKRMLLNPARHLPKRGGDCSCGGSSSATNRAPGSYYDGQDCAGHTLYDVYVEVEGLDTTFYYVAVGSC